MATITELLNNISGLTFRQTVNNNFTALNTELTSTTSATNTNTTNIATNTTDIATNTADTATNTTAISGIDTRLTTLEGFHTYDYNSASNITVTNDVYENVLTLTTPARDAGTYELRMSQLYTLNSTTNSAFFRFRVNGGTYVEVRREPKDNTDLIPMDYWRVLVHGGGTITIEIEARKENAADILTIVELTAAVDRKV